MLRYGFNFRPEKLLANLSNDACKFVSIWYYIDNGSLWVRMIFWKGCVEI